MRKLRIAFSKREKAEKLLANLEELKEKEEVGDERYGLMKEEYERLREEGELEVEALPEAIEPVIYLTGLFQGTQGLPVELVVSKGYPGNQGG